MKRIQWSHQERELLIQEVKKQFTQHPTMRTIDLVRMAQKISLPSDRRRDIQGIHNIAWIEAIRLGWDKDVKKNPPIVVEELPPVVTPKPDLMAQLVELLSDAMVQVVAEAIVAARAKLDLPVVDIPIPVEVVSKPPCKTVKKIAVYGLFSNQVGEVRTLFKDCFEFRFLKDVSNHKMESAAQWADMFIVMTKFVSHDYAFLKKYGNIRYVNGAASSLIAELEGVYLADCEKEVKK